MPRVAEQGGCADRLLTAAIGGQDRDAADLTGHAPAPQRRWRPYEALDWPGQQPMLEAAVALHRVDAGDVAAWARSAPAPCEPYQPIPSTTHLRSPQPVDH
jgi:hypothetical protein